MAKMEWEMITLRHVMTVELALEREMAYRKKMEAAKTLPLRNLEHLLPLQVSSPSQVASNRKEPSPSQVGLKRKEPSQNVQVFLKKQPSSSIPFHKRSKGFLCNVCQIEFSTISHLKQHSETPSHRSHVLTKKVRRENVSTPFRCKLCDSSCSSGAVMEHHVNGSKHTATLIEFDKAKKGTDETFAAYRWVRSST